MSDKPGACAAERCRLPAGLVGRQGRAAMKRRPGQDVTGAGPFSPAGPSRYCCVSAASSARPPERMPSMPTLPSWQAYSYITWSVIREKG